MSELPDWEYLDAVDLWLDRRQEDVPESFEAQDRATQKMYYDHEDSLWLYRESGGVV